MYPDAACQLSDPELFFPVRTSGDEYEAQLAEAQAVCAGCPVRARCLEENLDMPFGIWGGLDRAERGDLLKARGRVHLHGGGRVDPKYRTKLHPFGDQAVVSERVRREHQLAALAGDKAALRKLTVAAGKRRERAAKALARTA